MPNIPIEIDGNRKIGIETLKTQPNENIQQFRRILDVPRELEAYDPSG